MLHLHAAPPCCTSTSMLHLHLHAAPPCCTCPQVVASDLTSNNFDTDLDFEPHVPSSMRHYLVMFYAPWCLPCARSRRVRRGTAHERTRGRSAKRARTRSRRQSTRIRAAKAWQRVGKGEAWPWEGATRERARARVLQSSLFGSHPKPLQVRWPREHDEHLAAGDEDRQGAKLLIDLALRDASL